jgi:hypothetical protein
VHHCATRRGWIDSIYATTIPTERFIGGSSNIVANSKTFIEEMTTLCQLN